MVQNDSPYGVTFYTFDPVKGTLPPQLIPDMKSLGLTWLRYQLPWPFIERNPGVYIWDALDAVVLACNQQAINLCYVIQQSPQFYRQQVGANSCVIQSGAVIGSNRVQMTTTPLELPANTPVLFGGGQGVTEILFTSPRYVVGTNPVLFATPLQENDHTTMHWYLYPDPQATKTFSQRLAARYNGQNGHGTIQAFEIGNEEYDSQNPNGCSINAYLDRDPQYYINVLPVVSSAIRAVHPTVQIGMCAIWWNQLPHASRFLASIYQADPTMKQCFDYVNFHYYPFESGSSNMVDVHRWCYTAQPASIVPSFSQEWQALAMVMRMNGDAGKPIRVTEFGWYTTASQPYRGMANMVTEEVQARNYFSLLESARLSGMVSHVFFWTLDYAPTSAALNRDQSTGPGVPSGGYPISDAYSLVQVKYVNGNATLHYTKAFTTLKNYTSCYPQWVQQSDQVSTLLGADSLISVPTVASPGPRADNLTSLGHGSDDQVYSHLQGNALISFQQNEGLLSTTSPSMDILRYGNSTAQDQVITIRFKTDNLQDCFGLVARLSGTNHLDLSGYILKVQGNTISILKILRGAVTVLTSCACSQTSRFFYRMRFYVSGTTSTVLCGDIWSDYDVEPRSWVISATDTSNPFSEGGFGLYAECSSPAPISFDSLMAMSFEYAQPLTPVPPTPTPVPFPPVVPPVPVVPPAPSLPVHDVLYHYPQSITNKGTENLIWNIVSDQLWCTFDVVSGVIPAGVTQNFTIFTHVTHLPQGTHTATVTVTTSDGSFIIPINVSIPLS